jgi:hypothetical protein
VARAKIFRAALPAPALQQFVQELRTNRSARLSLPLPDRDGSESFSFATLPRPVPDSMLPTAVFVAGTAASGLAARIVALSGAELHLAVFSADQMYVADLRADAPVQYQRIDSAPDTAGRICAVTQADDPTPAADDAPFVATNVAGRAAVTQLRLAVATSPSLRAEYDDPVALEKDVADAVHFSNAIFNRDLGVDLVLSGPPLDAEKVNLLADDALRRLHTHITELAAAAGQDMDLGHLFDLGGAGRAAIGAACSPDSKAGAFSRTPDQIIPNGLGNFIHEIGHQLGALHSFNQKDDGRQGRGAYEPGLGVSIMSYGPKRQQYFHASSMAFVGRALANAGATTQAGCGTNLPASVAVPLVKVRRTEWYVPPLTPFELDVISDPSVHGYRWDAFDRGARPDGLPPFFQSNPERSPSRIYPAIADVLSRTIPAREWPVNRAVKFRVVGFSSDDTRRHEDVAIHVGFGEPFQIDKIACAAPCSAGSSLELRWRSSGTDRAPYRVETLRAAILDATNQPRFRWYALPDAGALANAAGFARLILPSGLGEIPQARVVLRANDGIFLAISSAVHIVDATSDKATGHGG